MIPESEQVAFRAHVLSLLDTPRGVGQLQSDVEGGHCPPEFLKEAEVQSRIQGLLDSSYEELSEPEREFLKNLLEEPEQEAA